MAQHDDWLFAIDVGGTFTDALGRSPSGVWGGVKLLSSGQVLGQAVSGGAGTLVDPRRCEDPPNWFAGWRIEVCGQTARVVSSDRATGRLSIEPAVDVPAGTPYSLRCDQPPPLLAVRWLLGIGLAEPIGAGEIRLGTTRGTNALLERKGSRVGLLTTRGMGDLHTIGDQTRPDLFALAVHRPAPLAAVSVELDERLGPGGEVHQALEADALERGVQALAEAGVESVAIALLHAWKDDRHERMAHDACRRAGFDCVASSAALDRTVGLLARTETAVAEAYLAPVVRRYVDDLVARAPAARLRLMTSGGALASAEHFRAIDSVLSGPAGGVVATAALARELALGPAIGFDMGGTSTDVCRTDDDGEVCRVSQVELRDHAGRLSTRVRADALAIETVAAGGGSVCRFDGIELAVGPQSAGADPGPACYGRGGPLTVTDVDLLLGRLVPARFPFPLDLDAAQRALEDLQRAVECAGGPPRDPLELAAGLALVVDEQMASAVRQVTLAKGHDPAAHALVAFGGAGGVHACAVARALGIRRVVSDPLAGSYSAAGIAQARVRAARTWQVGESLDAAILARLALDLSALAGELEGELAAEGVRLEQMSAVRATLRLRYRGQTAAFPIEWSSDTDPRAAFEAAHRARFGFVLAERTVEIATCTVERTGPAGRLERAGPGSGAAPAPIHQAMRADGVVHTAATYLRAELRAGERICGPAIVLDPGATTVVDPGWTATLAPGGALVIDRDADPEPIKLASSHLAAPRDPLAEKLFAGRLDAIAREMGECLRASALSTNIVERLDYSCAIFDADGGLLVNAPHVPVHLGAMSRAVRALVERCGAPGPDAVLVSNDPYAGGSHLPDVTVALGVHLGADTPILYVASRAHHAEIGGTRPGSFPPDARCLAEEGVVIPPLRVSMEDGAWRTVLERVLREAPYPSRAVDDNLADLAAQIAAGRRGVERLRELVVRMGPAALGAMTQGVRTVARRKLARALARLPRGRREFACATDDGVPIQVAIELGGPAEDPVLAIDFTGTGPVSRNLSAPRAVAESAVLYVLRCLVGEDVPLNAGLLERVRLVIPPGLLDPPAGPDAESSPPVVGGNVETSQRVVDVLLGALGVAAASQGTMNNVVFGDARFGYYETLGGGTGATPGAHGCDAIHSHMTNTRLADPESLELRYPVRLLRCAIRPNSGGKGRWRGGAGMVREYEFTRALELSLLTQRRTRAPYGSAGGSPGAVGRNTLIRNGVKSELPSIGGCAVERGDRLVIETPGGGGWGVADAAT